MHLFILYLINLSFASMNVIEISEHAAFHDINTVVISPETHSIHNIETIETDKRFQYGHLFNVDIDIRNIGKWEYLDDNVSILRLEIRSVDAFASN